MELTDTFGRTINYLRLSVTDRCNMRCVYCMPADGIPLGSHDDILSYEELLAVARAAVATGIEKIRVTGGEPLVRRGIIPFLAQLAALPGLHQLVLTTNGLHLEEMAEDLRRAGVQRLNISLDSLRPETFAAITRGASLQRVLAVIDARSPEPLTQAGVAKEVRMSPPAFCRWFKSHMGRNFQRHLNEIRVARVWARLADTDENITTAALDCGFRNLSNFNRRFLEATGLTPRQFRAKTRQISAKRPERYVVRHGHPEHEQERLRNPPPGHRRVACQGQDGGAFPGEGLYRPRLGGPRT